jgi:hypothetical protein
MEPAQMIQVAPGTTLLNENEAAETLRVRPQTLRVMRMRGNGPTFIKVGRRVFYDAADVRAYLKGRSFRTTTQARVALENCA